LRRDRRRLARATSVDSVMGFIQLLDVSFVAELLRN